MLSVSSYMFVDKILGLIAIDRIVIALVLMISATSVHAKDIKICHEANYYPPYIYSNGLDAVGILVDIIDHTSGVTTKSIELYSNSWSRCKEDVIAGRAHALFAMVHTKERETLFAFPPNDKLDAWHMWLAQYPIFIPSDTELDINSYQPDKGIGAPLGYVVWDHLQQKNWLSPFEYEPTEGLLTLSRKRLDGYVVERLIGLNLIKDNNLTTTVKMSKHSLLDTKWYLPFNKAFYHDNKNTVHLVWKNMAKARDLINKKYDEQQ